MKTARHTCQICGAEGAEPVFAWKNVPSNIGILWPSRTAALDCARGDLEIAFCRNCGYLWNTAFDPARLEYSQAYDNNLHYSPVYRKYAEETAGRLIGAYGLRNKTVMEIGCGKGDFLILLCTLGDNRGIGFDASYQERGMDPALSERITVIRDFYGERYRSYTGDLVACRYVLEHIADPLGFLRMLRTNIGDDRKTVVYFEVPDVYLILEQGSIWDFIYEHVSYFSPGTLALAFEQCGFQVQNVAETFGNQFAAVEALAGSALNRPAPGRWSDLARLEKAVPALRQAAREKTSYWLDMLEQIRICNRRAVLWGAGAKGVSFLNMLGISEEIACAVDINPNKQGRYMPGTGQKIVSPESLPEYRPDLVIVMNPLYLDEIRAETQRLGLAAEVLCA